MHVTSSRTKRLNSLSENYCAVWLYIHCMTIIYYQNVCSDKK